MFAVDPQSRLPDEADVWHALSDTTRRALIDRLAGGPRTTGRLCDDFPLSRFAVMKHLGVLERAGLVISRKDGRTRVNHLNVAPLHALQSRWLSPRASARGAAIQTFAHRSQETEMSASEQQLSHVEIALDWEIQASIQKVWRLLFDEPEAWWPAEFRAGPAGSVMRLEERVGSALREERPDGGGLQWYAVIALDPMRSLDLSGHLASRYGGPATSLLHIELAPGRIDGSTLFKLTDSVFGRLGAGFGNSASSGWQAIFGESFKARAERS